MSAPPLPEIFGNYALGDFVEVVAPAGVSWWPQTAGWWWLGAALAFLVARRGWQWLRHWHRNRYRREATALLRQLAPAAAGGSLVAEVNRLLKLTALAAFPRQQVAQLSGADWVEFLNRQCPAAPFDAAQRELLALAPYRSGAPDEDSGRQLLAASLAWVREHRNCDDV
jgi:hypothetical protein